MTKQLITYTLPPTRYRRPSEKEALTVLVDIGNGDEKIMLLGCFGEQVYFPQAVVNPRGANWETLKQQYGASQRSFNGSAAFEIPGMEGGFIVGMDAERKGRRLMGAAKYTPDQIEPLIIGGLLQVYPRSHSHVRIVATHPQTATPKQLETFRALLGKIHIAEMPDGQIIKYKVRNVSFIPEAKAAFNTMVLTQQGQRRAKIPLGLREGSELLIFDGGSYISSFTTARVTKRGTIESNSNDSTPVNVGIEAFYSELDKVVRDAIEEVSGQDKLTQRQRREVLYSRSLTIRGKPVPLNHIEDGIKSAMMAFTNEVARIYHDVYNDGADFEGIAISGGGGAGAFEDLEDLFKHDNIAMVEEDVEMMRFGAINGASKTVSAEEGVKAKEHAD